MLLRSKKQTTPRLKLIIIDNILKRNNSRVVLRVLKRKYKSHKRNTKVIILNCL